MRGMLCAAVVMSSLWVGWGAPLTCESLAKPLENQKEKVSGTWYLVGVTSKTCLLNVGLELLVGNLLSLDFKPNDALRKYDGTVHANTFGGCNSAEYDMSAINNHYRLEDSEVGQDASSSSGVPIMMQTSCPDCQVISMKENKLQLLLLLSRRSNLTAAELEEFSRQAACLAFRPPVIFAADKRVCRPPVDYNSLSVVEQMKYAHRMAVGFCHFIGRAAECMVEVPEEYRGYLGNVSQVCRAGDWVASFAA